MPITRHQWDQDTQAAWVLSAELALPRQASNLNIESWAALLVAGSVAHLSRLDKNMSKELWEKQAPSRVQKPEKAPAKKAPAKKAPAKKK